MRCRVLRQTRSILINRRFPTLSPAAVAVLRGIFNPPRAKAAKGAAAKE
jgi:hypothetical protein